jgi:hypothetical protein
MASAYDTQNQTHASRTRDDREPGPNEKGKPPYGGDGDKGVIARVSLASGIVVPAGLIGRIDDLFGWIVRMNGLFAGSWFT